MRDYAQDFPGSANSVIRLSSRCFTTKLSRTKRNSLSKDSMSDPPSGRPRQIFSGQIEILLGCRRPPGDGRPEAAFLRCER
jgi:hypothetical protein